MVPVVAEPIGAPDHAAQETIRALVWPRRPAFSIGSTIALALVLFVPVVMAGPGPLLALTAAPPTLTLAYVTRLVFEALMPRAESRARRAAASLLAAGFGLGFVALVGAILALDLSAPSLAVAMTGATVVLLAATGLRTVEQRRGTANRRIVFAGSAVQFRELADEIRRRGDLHLADHPIVSPGVSGGRDVEAMLDALRPSTLVLSTQASHDDGVVGAAKRLHARGVRVRSLHEFYEQEFRKVAMSDLSPSWFLFDVAAIHRHRAYGLTKRLVETAAAGLLLIMSAPLFPVIALAVRMSGPGPILFRQVRVGRNGEHIQLPKFRTMHPADDRPAEWAVADTGSITSVGRLLRRFRLDEIPQLVSVVKGQLALVGPRPEQPAIVERLCGEVEFYDVRHCVRPGLTGWAQVNRGYGGSTRDVVEKLQYDLFYVKHQSLLLDLRVIVATVRTILAGRGA